jgi:predicted anti-sigma-YlaC factor YlaD
VGSLQVLLAAAQALGADIGTAGAAHAAMMSGHLVNESTAWAAALGVVMIVAAVRPTAAAGLAGVLGVFTGLLVAYVIADALADAVTPIRMLSHLPALAGTVLAVLVWRDARRPQPGPCVETSRGPDEITLPDNASRGRRRGHLWPTDGSAA